MKIYIVIPAFNEAKVIRGVLEELKKTYENIIVVNDASEDDTADIARESGCTVLEHLINRGQGAALKTGIGYALRQGADCIVTFDADGQHRASDVEKLLKPLADSTCNVTLGSRFLNKETVVHIPSFRRVLLRLAIAFSRISTGLKVTDTHNGLRAFTAKAARMINFQNDRMAHASEILESIKKNKLTYTEIPVEIHYSDYSMQKGQHFGDFVKILFKYLIYKLK